MLCEQIKVIPQFTGNPDGTLRRKPRKIKLIILMWRLMSAEFRRAASCAWRCASHCASRCEALDQCACRTTERKIIFRPAGVWRTDARPAADMPAGFLALTSRRQIASRSQSACQTAEESSRGARCPALSADACGRWQTREDYGKAHSAGNAPEPCAL
jgi:hypothetical protein